MHVLILGGGGREHALAWKVAQSPLLNRLTVAPGNAGIAQIAECVSFDILNSEIVTAWAKQEAVDLVVVGPEAPLAAGVADALRAGGISVFGPSQAAAQLEASKAFTKEICDACGAPTALGPDLPMLPRLRPIWPNAVHPSSSRRMVLPQARAL